MKVKMLMAQSVVGLTLGVQAAFVTPEMIRGPFPILSTPFNDRCEVDYEDLAKGVRYVADSGCPGVIWCQSNDAIDLLSFEEKKKGYEACAKAMQGRSTVMTLGVNGTLESMLREARAVEEIAVRYPDAKIAMISRPPDDGKTQDDIRRYYEQLGEVARRPVIIQTYVNETCPPPEVGLLLDLARRYPAVYGYIKEESGGDRANYRMLAEVGLKPAIKTVFSAWGGWQWAFQSRRLGSEGVISERCAYAPLLAYIWQQMENGDKDGRLTQAFALFRLLIDQRDFPVDGLRGYSLHIFNRLGIFKSTMSRRYKKSRREAQGTVVTGDDRHSWEPMKLELNPFQIAELEKVYDDAMRFLAQSKVK